MISQERKEKLHISAMEKYRIAKRRYATKQNLQTVESANIQQM